MATGSYDISSILEKAEKGIHRYLDLALAANKIDEQSYAMAKKNTLANLSRWLNDSNIDRISPQAKAGIIATIEAGQWEAIVNAFRKKMSFGTGGIRGFMAQDKASIIKLKNEGIDAQILKGPNTLNNIVLLQTSAGVAKIWEGQKVLIK